MKILKISFLIACTIFLSNIFGSTNNSSLPNGVEIYQLDNGIQVLLIQKPNIPMVGINTVVKVGSAYETFATSGMSHMLEHLLFNGTTTMKQKELYDAVDLIGGYNNANTSEYYTNFMMVTPAENIEEGMKIQSAMLFDSVLPKKKFVKEKGIVLEEIAKTLANPQSQVERNTNAVLFKGHALSLPTLGTYETIKHMTRDEVYNFYKNYYVPNNMIINVIGNFNFKTMHKLLKQLYGSKKPGSIVYPELPQWSTGFESYSLNNDIRNLYHKFYKGKNLQYQIFYKLPNVSLQEYYDLLEEAANGKTEKLKKYLDDKFPGSIKSLRFSTVTSPVANFLEVKIILIKNIDYLKLNKYLTSQLNGQYFAANKFTIESESIKAVTDFYKNTEKPHMFGIFNADKFAEYGIESVLSSYNGSNYAKANNQLKNLNVSKAYSSIVEHPFLTQNKKMGMMTTAVKLFKAENGKPALIVKQAPRSNLLAIHYLLKYKSAYESKFGKNAAEYWNDAFGQRMNSPEIKKQTIKYGFDFSVNDNPYIPMDNIYLDPTFGYIRIEGLANDVKSAIEFLNKQMLNFVPTKEEFNKAKQNFAYSGMMSHGNKAKKLFNKKLSGILYKKGKYNNYKEKLTYDKLLEFGKYYFNPQNMIISVVSPTMPAKVKEYFSDFSSSGTKALFTGAGYQKEFNAITSSIKFDTTAGGEQAYLYFGYQKKINDKDKPVLKALSLILSDKIVFDIREKQGLAYRMSAGIDAIGNKAMFYINMGTRPENTNKIIPQFPKYFTTKFLSKITEKDLRKSVNMYLGRMMFRRLSSVNQAYYLGHSYYFYNDINYDKNFLQNLKNVNLDDVKRLAKKYLNVKYPIEVFVR